MTTMSSNRCSEWAVLLVVVVLALSTVPAAAAIDASEEASPDDVEVGSAVEDGDAVYTLENLYSEADSWVLSGETDLQDAQWTIVWYGQAGERLDRATPSGESFNVTVDRNDPDLDAEPTSVEVSVTGTVPEVTNYTYEPQPSFTLAALAESPEGNSPEEILNDSATHYTEDSRAARNAIEEAESAIDAAQSAGGDTSEAESSLSTAKSVYQGENPRFTEAQDLAERAQSEAQAAEDDAESGGGPPLLLYGGAGVVVLLVLGGGLYWYSQGDDDDYGKLS
jgi:hypothetical protein